MDDMGFELEKLIGYGSKEAVIQNMKDAGCSQDTIECLPVWTVVRKRSF